MFLFCSVRKYRTSAFALVCARSPYYNFRELKLPPNHLIHDTHIALNNLHYLCADILINIVRHRDSMLTVFAKLYSSIYSLKETLLVDAGNDEVTLVDGFGTFGRCADADGRERMAYAGEEAALLRECAAVAHYGEGVHL